MILLYSFLLLSISFVNLLDKPVSIDYSKNQIIIVISGGSCHECLQNIEQWTSKTNFERTAVIWYNKTLIEKKKQIEFYKQYINPQNWLFSKNLDSLKDKFNLEHTPNIIVLKNGKLIYFSYDELFYNNSRSGELENLINN